ncbi:MAG: hypothetical protein QM788_14140 [Roseateles sp.]|uniref:hypothetical protein n=1 Tax=Roseateles sp. TaxID=1971397 RepID=UPI0039EB5A46
MTPNPNRLPWTLALLASSCLATLAQATPDFAPFLADWRAAVARGDADAVARRLRGPFLWEGRALDAAGFRRHAWPVLFTPALRRCWARTAPVAEPGQPGERALFCGPYGLHFDAQGGPGSQWALREFSADGEAR